MLSTIHWRKRTKIQTTESNIWQDAWKAKIDYLCCVLIEAQICIKIKKFLITDPIILQTVTSICSSFCPRSFLVHFPLWSVASSEIFFSHFKVGHARREDRQIREGRVLHDERRLKYMKLVAFLVFADFERVIIPSRRKERDFLKRNLLCCQSRKTIDGVDRDWCGKLI